jgi:hypothetical protein
MSVQQEELNKPTAGSTGTYTSVLKARVPELTKVSIVVANAHATATLNWKVLVSNDPEGAAGTWAEEKAEAALTGTSVSKHLVSQPVIWVDVQIQSTDTSSPQANVWLLGVG